MRDPFRRLRRLPILREAIQGEVDSVRTIGQRLPVVPAAVGASTHFIGDHEFPKLSPIQPRGHDIRVLSGVGFARVHGLCDRLRRGND